MNFLLLQAAQAPIGGAGPLPQTPTGWVLMGVVVALPALLILLCKRRAARYWQQLYAWRDWSLLAEQRKNQWEQAMALDPACQNCPVPGVDDPPDKPDWPV